MKRYRILIILIVLTACVGNRKEIPSPQSITYLPQTNTPYENGKYHGLQLKNEVRLQIEGWEKGITSILKIDRDSMCAIVYKHTNFLTAIERFAPELREEMNGIADGAGLDRDLVLYFNLGEEIFNFCTTNVESCSNIAFQGNDIRTLAYNQDLPTFLHGKNRPVILDHQDHYVFTMPGSIALSGVSNKLAVSCNSLPMLRMNKDGLPLVFFIRQLLTLNTMEEVQQYIAKVPLAIAQNLLLISPTEISNIEISKNQTEWESAKGDGFYHHTNFPLRNTDFKSPDYRPAACERYNYLDQKKVNLLETANFDPAISLESICAQAPIRNNETYLRFVVTYRKHQEMTLKFINPKTQESIHLKF